VAVGLIAAARARVAAVEAFILGFGNRVGVWYRRRALWLRTVLFLTVLLVVTASASIHLYFLSSDRAKEIRRELFQRDLRDLVGRFDADERFVLENNTSELIGERRALRPLLLPRAYYTGLPTTAATVLPRQPPRNCFVYLEPIGEGQPSDDDRFCSYFGESKAAGRYLYVAGTFAEDDVVPLKPGDLKMVADTIKIDIEASGQKVTWWLAFQPPPFFARRDRYELTAFRQVGDNQRDRDRKIEGWAYLQRQARSSRLHFIARLDFREFIEPKSDEEWPPNGWHGTTFSVERRDASANTSIIRTIKYRGDGRAELSLSSLGTQIFNAYGSIQLRKIGETPEQAWSIDPPENLRAKFAPGFLGAKLEKGDLLLPATPTSQSESIPDTNLSVTVAHPWRLIEKGFWQIFIYLLVLLTGSGLVFWYFVRALLGPIGEWAKYSEQLAVTRRDLNVSLPYGDQRNEIGMLATAINGLIKSLRDQMAQAHDEREKRAAESRRQRDQEVENRMQNLKVMGHEIRSPLQALMAIHSGPNDPGRRYVDRMFAALPHLMGGASAVDAIGSREMDIVEFDLAHFLSEVARNAEHADISQVEYGGPPQGVRCLADLFSFEDALTHVLNNADRHRAPDTPIRLVLVAQDEAAGVEVWNDGRNIPHDNLEKIFEFGFSTATTAEGYGQGVGLYVARDYLRRMRGTITARNYASGVVFTLMLPIAPSLFA